jgi:hypothetical protein
VDASSALNESVPVGFTDYCRDLVLYAHSIDDIKDDDIDKVKKEDYINASKINYCSNLLLAIKS